MNNLDRCPLGTGVTSVIRLFAWEPESRHTEDERAGGITPRIIQRSLAAQHLPLTLFAGEPPDQQRVHASLSPMAAIALSSVWQKGA